MPGCVSHRPGRHQAGGGRWSTSSSKSMCRQGVMGPSWRLFLGNRSQRMGNPLSLPPRPSQPPAGAPRGPPPTRTSPGACSQLWRGGGGGGKDACRIGPGRVGEGMDVARQPASSVAMATPPHPSWDAARPDDEVISGGERGRQAGRQRGPVGAWQAPKPAYRRHTLHPESRGRPCWTPPISTPGRADSSDDWHSASSARAVLAGAPKSPWCRAELSSPKLTASSQSLGDGNWGGGPYKQSNPQTKATAGPWELKNKGKAGGCLTGKGPPSTPLAPTTPEPPAASRR